MTGHDNLFLDPSDARLAVAYALRLAAGTARAPHDERALLAHVDALGERLNVAARERGWRIEPPFPAARTPIERLGETLRLLCAARLWTENGLLGVAFVTVISGRAAELAIAPPETVTPLLA